MFDGPPMSTVTRFAPSPTGFLHLGHAHAALHAWRTARAAGGQFLLRIEDIDPGRCRPHFTQAIQEDLAWLGLDWDGPVRVQSEHLAEYRAMLDALASRGLLYPCFCTRAEIEREVAASAAAPHGPDGAPLYPGTCRRMSPADRAARLRAGQAHALRLDMAAALAAAPGTVEYTELEKGLVRCDPARFGDIVLARKDAPASYHLCVTHDDAVQGVTVVTRGDDLRGCTDLHCLLQALMGWPTPAYHHFPLLRDAGGRRLSKRAGAPSLRALRDAGVTPEAARARAIKIPDGGMSDSLPLSGATGSY